MATKHYLSTKKRIKAITAIVKEEYQPGDNSRCYKAIWRRRIRPVYGVCYKTFLEYLSVPPSELEEDEIQDAPGQLKLF